MTNFIHETAIVDPGAKIGQDTKIWHWSHICKGATIGNNCSLGQNVYIANKVKIGNNCKIQNNVSIYDNIEIEDNVFCGPSMVFTNVINPRSEISRKDEYKKTTVRQGVTIGANATIVCGVTLNMYSFIGAGAVVTKDTKAFSLTTGVPAKQIGWMSRYGERIELPLTGEGLYTCPFTNDIYKLEKNNIKLIVQE